MSGRENGNPATRAADPADRERRAADDISDRADVSAGLDTRRELTDAARRALAEAEARRAEADRGGQVQPKELGGRDGPDPVRYGDWEKGGIVSDF